MHKKLLRSLLLVISMFAVSGCGIIDMIYLPPAEDTAQEIFEAANDAMSEKNYVRAVELYNKLRDTYPFSPYTVDAELSLADAYVRIRFAIFLARIIVSRPCTAWRAAPLSGLARKGAGFLHHRFRNIDL